MLACVWIERELGPVPVEFSTLVDRLLEEGDLRRAIDALILRKKSGAELDMGPRIPIISDYLNLELARLSKIKSKAKMAPTPYTLDEVFLKTLTGLFGLDIKCSDISTLPHKVT